MVVEVSPLKFYKNIEDKSKYKLINGLFIVRYKDETTSEHVGDLYFKKVRLNTNEFKQLFRKENGKVFTHTRMDIQAKYPTYNFWKEIDTCFIEAPIESILETIKEVDE